MAAYNEVPTEMTDDDAQLLVFPTPPATEPQHMPSVPSRPPPRPATSPPAHTTQLPEYDVNTLPEDFLRVSQPIPVNTGTITHRPTGMLGVPQNTPSSRDESSVGGGLLFITLTQAKLAKNYGLTRMDPFVRMAIGGEQVISQVCENGWYDMKYKLTFQGARMPIWNERFTM